MSVRTDPTSAPPIVCTLGGTDQATRFDEWRALARSALIGHGARPDGAVLRYRRTARDEAELRRLVALESHCCAFLAFEIESTDEELRLTVSGPVEAASLIRDGWGVD